MPSVKAWRRPGLSLLIGVWLLAGCASQTPVLLRASSGLPQQVELIGTPFFAQDSHQCGPASLAMALGAAGFNVTPEALQPQVYLPSRQGSLQTELLAAARRQRAFPIRVKPQMDALLAEVAGGHPVVILQNLGLSWQPRWHYAVVVGYDLPRREIILRSGPNTRETMALTTFEHTWARSDYWGMLVMRPGQLPVRADANDVAIALTALEKHATSGEMRVAYRSALARWPEQPVLQMGLGNAAYRAGDLREAEALFRSMAARAPDNAAALNNLATVLRDQNRLDEALAAAEQASAIAGPWQAHAQTTRDAIREALRVQRGTQPPHTGKI